MPQTAHIPVVIMTAYRLDMVEKDKIAAQAQPDDFVNKGSPIFDTLQEVLEGAIKKAKDRHAMTTAKTITSEAKPKEAPPINKPASDDGSPKPDGAKAAKAEESGTAAKSATEPKSSKKSPAPASSGKKRAKASSKSTGKPASSKTSKSSPGKSEGR
jgi:hypothetical protein